MRLAPLALILSLATASAQAQCGGSFDSFLSGIRLEAITQGHSAATVDRFLSGAAQDPKVLRADRSQGIFRRPFTDFARRVISAHRLQHGQKNAATYAATFDRIERQYGIAPGVLLAFWALETDYGAFQGDYNTRNALLTLAHDCRRPELFRPQVLATVTLYARGDFDPHTTTGAWAGEIGQVQMLPADIIENGVDGDGDGKVTLKTSAQDALMSGAKMLSHLGWQAGEPWLQEVSVPSRMDWSLSGLTTEKTTRQWARMGIRAKQGDLADLPASLILPEGRNGPAFLAYPNFRVFFEWNQSFVYVTTAAYFATRLEGASVFTPGSPSPQLELDEMKLLQRRLMARGHNVGDVDGILGARTRAAVQAEQARLGLPADAWPTRELLSRL